jgi:hypothetical protein
VQALNPAELLMQQLLGQVSPTEDIGTQKTNLDSADVDSLQSMLQASLDGMNLTESKKKEEKFNAKYSKEPELVRSSLYPDDADTAIETGNMLELGRVGTRKMSSHKGLPQGAN